MSQPRWITPAGELGTVPELSYYDFALDAYDAAGGSMTYSLISGRLPPGLQLIPAGRIQGIPVSETRDNQNLEYRFTIRAKNTTTNSVVDRSFSIVITNISPPEILPKDVDLGTYLDGTFVSVQLEVIEANPEAVIEWRIKDGSIPPGTTLDQNGLLSGYLEPVPSPEYDPDWDMTYWDQYSWDFSPVDLEKTYTFVVEVFDGLNYDQSTYTLTVTPVSHLLADSTTITADNTQFTIDLSSKHNPIILNDATIPIVIRQNSFLLYKINAIDLDRDRLQYIIPTSAAGGFDGQTFIGNSVPYVPSIPVGGYLYEGLIATTNPTEQALIPNQAIKVLGYVSLTNPSPYWFHGTISNTLTLTLQGPTIVTASLGDTLTQSISGGVATVTDDVNTLIGVVEYAGNIDASAGDYIVDGETGGYALITNTVSNGTTIGIQYTTVGNIMAFDSELGGFDDVIYDAYADLAPILSYPQVSYLGPTPNFNINSGNTFVGAQSMSPSLANVINFTDVNLTYVSSNLFKFNITGGYGNVAINSVDTGATPVGLKRVGITVGPLSDENSQGYDTIKFDENISGLPGNITLDLNSGWLSGHVGSQSQSELIYNFEVIAFKRDDPFFDSSKVFTLRVLGDVNNEINWITPEDLGTIENGSVSDLFVEAVSTEGRRLHYELTPGARVDLPQGITLLDSGNLAGRVTFEMFQMDRNTTTFDGGTTSFDCTHTFSVTASDYENTVSSVRVFTVRVINSNVEPYEDIYVKALPSFDQRQAFNSIMNDPEIFPRELIYRPDDPNFGIASSIRSLFLAGLNPSSLREYAEAIQTNHYEKNVRFGEIKTAVAQDANFDVKYEVVYLEVFDNDLQNSTDVTAKNFSIENLPNHYYDQYGNEYVNVYPNLNGNMKSVLADGIGYENKGALPKWMTSRQEDGTVLGFTRAVVLAYTKPGASNLIAFRLKKNGFNFNSIDFTIDRYVLDNQMTQNYDVETNQFEESHETTFDRYPELDENFTFKGAVDYAVGIAYDEIDGKHVSEIIANHGGLDGNRTFQDGEMLVFATQEFRDIFNNVSYNTGWTNVLNTWDSGGWDTQLPSIGDEWDAANYVPGYTEHLLDSSVPNRRAGVWKINIDANGFVDLEFMYTMDLNDTVFVRYGFSYGGRHLYYDPFIKPNNTVPNYSEIPEEVRNTGTTFDGNSTVFYDNRDVYAGPEENNHYIKFPQTGVFV